VSALLAWLEGSALGHAMRASGVWAYAIVNLVHILSVASLFGSVLIIDLRLLGAWRRVPLASLSAPAVPIARTAFFAAAVSGICMLSTNGSQYRGNPFLLIKFPAMALGLLNVAVLSRLPGWKSRGIREPTEPERRQLAIAGGCSLAAWLTTIGAGRMIGYW
jgi:hypothetical protein